METLHSFVKASRMPPPSGGARMPEMLVVGQMMEYFERHPDKNAMATGELSRSARVHDADADAYIWTGWSRTG